MSYYGLENGDLVQVDAEVTRCTIDDWQRRVSIYNTADDTGSAADVASAQVRPYVCRAVCAAGVEVWRWPLLVVSTIAI